MRVALYVRADREAAGRRLVYITRIMADELSCRI